MDVNFINKDVAGESFERGRQAHETTRRQEEIDFEARRQREQAAGVDKAIREGIGAIYAKPAQTAPAPSTTPVQVEPPPVAAQAPAPAPTTAPAPAAAPPAAAMPVSTGAPNPAAAKPPPNQTLVIAAPKLGQRNTLPPDTGAPNTPATLPVSAPTPAAAPSAQPPAPTAAISGINPRPAPAARPQAGGDELMSRLTKTPGGGTAAMNLHGSNVAAASKAHEESRADRDKGTELFIKAFEAGQPDLARQVATQYQLNIPDQLFGSKTFTSEMTRMANFLKPLGIKSEDAAQFVHEALRTMPHEQETFEQQSARYANALTKVTGKKKVVESATGLIQVPEAGGAGGEYIMQPGTNKPAMPAPKTMVHISNDADKPTSNMRDVDAMVKAGVAKTQAEAWNMIRTAKTDPLAKQKLARNLMSSAKDRAGRPIYKTIEDAMKALDDAEPPAGGGRAPAAPAGEAPAAAPPARTQRTATALPMTAEGRPDAGKLVDGQSYSFKTKSGQDVTGTWNAKRKKFE